MIPRFLLMLVLLLPWTALASPAPVDSLTQDSIPKWLRQGWIFATGDDKARAAIDYNDTGWKPLATILNVAQDADTLAISGVSWFRLHLHIDSTLVDVPLAVRLTQEGASEIYLDGKLIRLNGTISGKDSDSSERDDPQRIPFIIVFHSAGPHVFAVRYANDGAMFERRVYHKREHGFNMSIAEANEGVFNSVQNGISTTFVIILLLGIFFTLGIVHILIYAFHKADRSNLYFSVFNLCIAATLFAIWTVNSVRVPAFKNFMVFLMIGLFSMAFLALSGFTNLLFAKSKKRFYALAVFCLITITIRFFNVGPAMVSMTMFICCVVLEAIILIARAMIKGVAGARILGAGMMLFLLFFAFFIVKVLITDNFEFEAGSTAAFIVQIVGSLAILSMPVSISAYLAWRFSAINRDLQAQLIQVQQLSTKTMEQEMEKQRLLETRQEELEVEVAARTMEVREQHEALKGEKKKSDDLLLNILPAEVAEELKESGSSKARSYDEVSVLFTDFVNFTGKSEQLSPDALVAELDYCFREFDAIITRFNLEKIKTIGDAYLAVAGLPVANARHAQDTVGAALAIRAFMMARREAHPDAFSIRLGVHSGPVVAGIVGVKKFAYDIWGDTVNTAARMEQHGATDQINISAATYHLVKDQYSCTYRGELAAKNKGKLGMYFVNGRIMDDRIPD